MKKSKNVSYSSDEVKRLPDESNWERSAAMTDEEIDAAIASDPDEAGLGDDWMERGLVMQSNDRSISPPAEIRKRLNVSQRAFAELLGVSVRTVQEWEQGRRQPTGPARALLRIVDQNPEVLLNLR